jgi:hypothetical protein
MAHENMIASGSTSQEDRTLPTSENVEQGKIAHKPTKKTIKTTLEERTIYPAVSVAREDVLGKLRRAAASEIAVCLRYFANPTDSVKNSTLDAQDLICNLERLTFPITFSRGSNSLEKTQLLAVLRFSRTDAQLITNVANWLCTQGALRREESTFECLAMILGVDWHSKRKNLSSLLHSPYGVEAYIPAVSNDARQAIVKRVRQFYPNYRATLEGSSALLAPQTFLEELFGGFKSVVGQTPLNPRELKEIKQAYIWINNIYIKRKGGDTDAVRLARYYRDEANRIEFMDSPPADIQALTRLMHLIATQIRQLEPKNSTMLKPLLMATFPEVLALKPDMKLVPIEESDGCCTTRFLRPF